MSPNLFIRTSISSWNILCYAIHNFLPNSRSISALSRRNRTADHGKLFLLVIPEWTLCSDNYFLLMADMLPLFGKALNHPALGPTTVETTLHKTPPKNTVSLFKNHPVGTTCLFFYILYIQRIIPKKTGFF